MSLSRREFVAITVTAVTLKNAIAQEPAAPSTQPEIEQTRIDAGPVSTFKEDKVYDQFRTQGFFLVRRGKQLLALSSVCTHKGCKVRVQEDRSYLCKCHHSQFDADGKVTNGPALRDLPRIAVALDDRGHVIVDLSQMFAAGHFGEPTTQK